MAQAKASRCLLEVASGWKISGKVSGIVHDNTANMIAMELLHLESNWDNQLCVGHWHTLQLFSLARLKELIIAKMLSIA